MNHYHAGGLFKHAVSFLCTKVAAAAKAALFGLVFWQLVGIGVTLLAPDKLANLLHLGGIQKGTLQANQVVSARNQHVTLAN